MDIDQYDYCPCGSGKKFKWCCQNIYGDIDRAYNQLKEGQQDTALRIINEVTRAHPTNPEAWGQQAQILIFSNQLEQADEALNKAFELNPNYPFGLLTRARLRADEGEFTGALLLARKAAEAYHADAHSHVGQVYGLIYQLEAHRHRPLASHAALRILIHCQPGDQELRDAYTATFGSGSHLPVCAREEYKFLQPSGAVSAERRKSWNAVLGQMESPRLQSVANAFEQLTAQDPTDAPAWFNLALTQAWLGENRKALESIERYLPLEEDEPRAGRAAAMAQVLRCGSGLENDADWKQYVAEYRPHEIEPLIALIQEWNEKGRLIVRPGQDPNILTAMILETFAPAIVTSETANATPDRRLAGYIHIELPQVRLWGPDEQAFARLREELRTRLGDGLGQTHVQIAPTTFGDVVSAALVFPPSEGKTPEEARGLVLENAHRHFEEVWIHRPLKYLAGTNPIDAVGHPLLRKKVRGIVQFMEDCAAVGILSEYDFSQLRHKLGLAEGAARSTESTTSSETADVSRMNAAELVALPVESLNDETLEQAFHAARALQVNEVAARFASALVARPNAVGAPGADRYRVFSFLVQHTLGESNTDVALDLVNEGQKQDCEANEGRRRNDYELHRAEVHVKRREADQAQDVFTRLIERSPENLKYRNRAARAMLSLGQPAQALAFAEAALTEAERQNDRDAQGELRELLEDARRRV